MASSAAGAPGSLAGDSPQAAPKTDATTASPNIDDRCVRVRLDMDMWSPLTR
jgi:hypothetical protein